MPWGQSSYLQQQATASANKSKEKKKKSVPSGYSGSTTFTSSSAAGGQASQTQAGIDHVANTLGLSDGEATALEGKDKKFYGSEASEATNQYLVSIGEAQVGNPYYDHQGNITGYSYILTSKGKEMKYGQSNTAMGSGDPTGIMTSTQISPEMWQHQNQVQAAILGILSFAAPMGAGQLLRIAAAKKLKDSPYSDYDQQFQNYQSGQDTISANQITNNQINNQTVANTAIGDTTDVASNNTTSNWAAHLSGKSVNLRKILT